MTKEKQENSLQLSGNELWIGEGYCVTCSDEAVQVRVVSVNEEKGFALVTADGVEEEVDVTLVEHIAPGDVLLVHGGVAIGLVDEESNA